MLLKVQELYCYHYQHLATLQLLAPAKTTYVVHKQGFLLNKK